LGTPEPGLVIPFVYLWRHEHEAGEESGRKIRPCLIVVAARRSTAGKVRVAVVPVTTQAPDTARSAVAVPKRVRTHLGLDAAASWVICDEYNEFDWPGVDLGTTSKGKSVFGYIPDALLEQVRAEMLAARKRGALRSVPRT
jgi:PemK-like, MazF-like toxin of type II toxin-antitoxin system